MPTRVHRVMPKSVCPWMGAPSPGDGLDVRPVWQAGSRWPMGSEPAPESRWRQP